MDLILDVNTQIYPMALGKRLKHLFFPITNKQNKNMSPSNWSLYERFSN